MEVPLDLAPLLFTHRLVQGLAKRGFWAGYRLAADEEDELMAWAMSRGYSFEDLRIWLEYGGPPPALVHPFK